MQELNDDLMSRASGEHKVSLENTAVKWAEYVLRNHDGEALTLGLEISKALTLYHSFLTDD